MQDQGFRTCPFCSCRSFLHALQVVQSHVEDSIWRCTDGALASRFLSMCFLFEYSAPFAALCQPEVASPPSVLLREMHFLLGPSVPALLGFQSYGGPGFAPPSNTTAPWSQAEMSDPAPTYSSGLQRGKGHPLSVSSRGLCGYSGFTLLSRKLTCNEVASSLLQLTRKRCTLQKVNDSHTSDSGHALYALVAHSLTLCAVM